MKKRAAIVLIIGIIMAVSLMACQKPVSEVDEGSEQATEVAGEVIEEADMAGTSETEQQAVQPEQASSMIPFTGSPEFQACAEWENFVDGYDTDGAILAEVDNEPIAGYKYEAYFCYSEEMEDKIDEICEKYGLSLLSGFQVVDNYNDLLSKAGIGGFCADSENTKHNPLCGYLYADGTFMIEGNVTLAGSSFCDAGYQFARAAKGTFAPAYLSFGDFSGYSAREYTTKKGETVYILCGADDDVYVVAEREKSFVVISGYSDLTGISDVNDERLEMLADAFDFAAIP